METFMEKLDLTEEDFTKDSLGLYHIIEDSYSKATKRAKKTNVVSKR
jgi:hypothetical protein